MAIWREAAPAAASGRAEDMMDALTTTATGTAAADGAPVGVIGKGFRAVSNLIYGSTGPACGIHLILETYDMRSIFEIVSRGNARHTPGRYKKWILG
jgi:hypothetical protein